MGIQIDISFDRQSATFHPTELVTGNVSVSTTDQLVVKELKLTFHGEGEVFWTAHQHQNQHHLEKTHDPHQPVFHQPHSNQIQPVHIVEYRNEETYLENSISLPLVPNSEIESDPKSMYLPVGFTQMIPFSFQLPSKLPSSYYPKRAHGSIKYFVEACLTSKNSFLKLPYESNKSYKKHFTVLGELDLALVNGALDPVVKEEERQFIGFSRCCKKGGEFFMKLELTRSGFLPGEVIGFQVEYKNESSATIHRITASLIQTITYITAGKQKTELTELCEDSQNTKIFPGVDWEWKSQLVVPIGTLPTDFGGCQIMLLRYSLKVIGYASWGRKCLLEVPIVIGTTIPQKD